MTTTTVGSISLQPWARNAGEESALKDVLARVNFERGHFRDITEASLQEEITTEGALELSESEEDEAEEDEDASDGRRTRRKATSREELYKAKYEMLANVRAAEQEILMSLDFISLLLSKDLPRGAQTTLSPHLRREVPMGTLGTDLWQRMPIDTARETQERLLATNVRMDGLQKSADDLMGAASRLEDNVRKETQYWEQILAISDNGWSVCKLPNQQHRLGVRFGFRESSPQFSRKGIAALNPGSDGTIALDQGIGSKPRSLKATLRRAGEIVGISKVQNIVGPEETTLESRLRYARDSLYDEELFHEMIRESRILTSLGVDLQGSVIQLLPESGSTRDVQISLELSSLDEHDDTESTTAHKENILAQAVVLAARLLLHHAHGERLKKRSDIPRPLSTTKQDDRPVLPILRPLASFIKHLFALTCVNEYVSSLSKILDAASISHEYRRAGLILIEGSEITNTETLINMLVQPFRSRAEIRIRKDETELAFTLHVETSLAYSFGSVYILDVPSRPQPYRFESIDDMRNACNLKVASALAQAVLPDLGASWGCKVRVAPVRQDVGPTTSGRTVWISLDSSESCLVADSPVRQAVWNVHGASYDKGFWAAVQEISETRS